MMCTFFIFAHILCSFFNTHHSLVRIVLNILLVEIRRYIAAIAIATCVIVQQKIARCGQAIARQHTTTPIGRAKERRLNRLEFARRQHYR